MHMSGLDVENWMHATDEERLSIFSAWDVDKGEAKDVAEDVAALLIRQCVYDVLRSASCFTSYSNLKKSSSFTIRK